MEKIDPEFQRVRAGVPDDIIVKLEVFVIPVSEQSGIPHRAELSAKRNIRVPCVQRIGCDALQPCSALAKLLPALGLVCPPATVNTPNRNSFSTFALKVWVQPATPLIEWVRRLRPKPGKRAS